MYFCVYFEKFPWNILPLALGIADCPLFSLLTLRSSSDFDAHCCSDENPSIRRIWSLTRELIRNVLFAWHLCCLKTPWNAIFCHKETTVMYSAVNTHIVIPQWKDINGSNKKSPTLWWLICWFFLTIRKSKTNVRNVTLLFLHTSSRNHMICIKITGDLFKWLMLTLNNLFRYMSSYFFLFLWGQLYRQFHTMALYLHLANFFHIYRGHYYVHIYVIKVFHL